MLKARVALLFAPLLWQGLLTATATANTLVTFNFNIPRNGISSFQIQLLDDQAPLTVANFLRYLNAHAFDSTIIHRNPHDFVMQGGGILNLGGGNGLVSQSALYYLPTYNYVQNEFGPTRSNVRGTIAMAKQGGNPDSATSQWFVNLGDNSTNLNNQNGGFTVFGQVVGNGMNYVDGVNSLPLFHGVSPFEDLPLLARTTSNGYADATDPNATFVQITTAGSGGYSLTLNNSGSPSTINVTTGSQMIAVPVVLYNDLQIDATSSTGSGAVASSLTVSGQISEVGGPRALRKTGTGALTLVGSSTYTGGTTLSGGTLQLGDATVGNGAVRGGIVDNATLVFANPLSQTFTGDISGSGSLTKTGTGLLLLSGSNSYAGDTTVSAGTLDALAIHGTGDITVATGATLRANYIDEDALIVQPGGSLILGNPSAFNADLAGAQAGSPIAAPLPTGATVAPEPSTLLLIASAALYLLLSLIRRRRYAR